LAALKANQRSIMTPIDQADIKNMMMTTALAAKPIWFHIETKSKPTSLCKSRNPQTEN
jgi:hypothetical protein